MKRKRIRKLNITSPWYLEEYLSWINEMGANGLHYKKTGVFCTAFEKDPSQRTHYRCSYIDQKMWDVYRTYKEELGWKYIASQQHFLSCRLGQDAFLQM